MATKTELRKQLEDTYYEGFEKNFWDLVHNEVSFVYNCPDEFTARIYALEKELYGKILQLDNTMSKAPFKNALKRWNAFKNSPLMKALK